MSPISPSVIASVASSVPTYVITISPVDLSLKAYAANPVFSSTLSSIKSALNLSCNVFLFLT